MIIVRVDDVGWGVDKRTDFGMKDYAKFHKHFAERNIPYVAGVIPAQFDNEMLAWAKENFYNGVAVFLHGWNHVLLPKSTSVATEFRSLTPEEQTTRIKLGLEKFKDFNVQGFIPPFNSYDIKTVQVCSEIGLKYMLVGAETRSGGRVNKLHPYKEYEKFYVIPEQWNLYCTGDYTKMLEVAETIKTLPLKPYPQIVSLHCVWEYQNLVTDCLPRLLDSLKDRVQDIRNFHGVENG